MALLYIALAFALPHLYNCHPQQLKVANDDAFSTTNISAAAISPDAPPRDTQKLTTGVVKRDVLRHAASNQSETQVAAANLDSTSRLKKRDIEEWLYITGYMGDCNSSSADRELHSIYGHSAQQVLELFEQANKTAQEKFDQATGYFEESNFYNITVGPYSLVASAFDVAGQGDDRFNWGDFMEIARYAHNQAQANPTAKRSLIGTVDTAAGKPYVDWAVTWSWWDIPDTGATGLLLTGEINTNIVADPPTTGGGRRLAIRDGETQIIRIPNTNYQWRLRNGAVSVAAWVLWEMLKEASGEIAWDYSGARPQRIENAYTGYFASFNWDPQSVTNAAMRAIVRTGVSFALTRVHRDKMAPGFLAQVVKALLFWVDDIQTENPVLRMQSIDGDLYYGDGDAGVKVGSITVGQKLHLRDKTLQAAQEAALAAADAVAAGTKASAQRVFATYHDEL